MTDNEERRVRARHDVTQVYRRQGVKRTASRQDLPRGDMIISGDPNPNNSSSISDDDIEDDTYIPSPGLVLMENIWLVQVGVGQQQMKKLKKRSRKKMMMMMMSREKLKILMLMRSTPPPHPHRNPNLSDTPELGLEGQD
jgi:hypothetical protein